MKDQFEENPDILDWRIKPDYRRSVSLLAYASQKELILPGSLSLLAPIAVGLFFRALGYLLGEPNMGAEVLGGYLFSSSITAIFLSVAMNASGGVWSGAKVY